MYFLCGVTKKTATVSMTPRSLSQRCQFYFRVWLRRLNDTAEFDFHHWHQSGSQIVLFFIRNKCKNVFKIYLRSIQLFLNMNHGTKWTEIKKRGNIPKNKCIFSFWSFNDLLSVFQKRSRLVEKRGGKSSWVLRPCPFNAGKWFNNSLHFMLLNVVYSQSMLYKFLMSWGHRVTQSTAFHN